MKNDRNSCRLIASYTQEDQRRGSRGVKRAGRASRRWHDRANHRPSQNENDLRNSEPNAERATHEQVREHDRSPKDERPENADSQQSTVRQDRKGRRQLLEDAQQRTLDSLLEAGTRPDSTVQPRDHGLRPASKPNQKCDDDEEQRQKRESNDPYPTKLGSTARWFEPQQIHREHQHDRHGVVQSLDHDGHE